VIARYLGTDYVIVVGRSSQRASNTRSLLGRASGHPPDFLTDHVARQVILFNDTLSPAAIAVGLTHEIIHVLGGALPGTRSLGDEELLAWNVALDFFLGLPDSVRAAAEAKYGAYARWRRERPEQFAATMRCQYPDTPGCPVPGAGQPPVRSAAGAPLADPRVQGGAGLSAGSSGCVLPEGSSRWSSLVRVSGAWWAYGSLFAPPNLGPPRIPDSFGPLPLCLLPGPYRPG
jgi:hypothetical protein